MLREGGAGGNAIKGQKIRMLPEENQFIRGLFLNNTVNFVDGLHKTPSHPQTRLIIPDQGLTTLSLNCFTVGLKKPGKHRRVFSPTN